ncbi:MAG: ABC transporter permease [Candidatus Omnitrophota bacterium]
MIKKKIRNNRMIKLKNINKTYLMGDNQVRALVDVSLNIAQGEFVAIMGPSGSGKSTLLHILGFLDRPDSGEYILKGKDVSSLSDNDLADLRNSVAGFVFQQFHLLSKMSALENVMLPLVYAGKGNLKAKAIEKIEMVGLADRADHRPNELSGGQQQRVAIARCLVNEPLIIFADEPTGNLDSKSEKDIINVIKELNSQGKTIVMVTHDAEVGQAAKRVICMRDGEIISDKINEGHEKQDECVSLAGNDSINGYQRAKDFGFNEISENFKQAVRDIFSNKLRSFLSMFGILIGVASVIAMLALGQGAKISMEENLSSLGTNILTVRPGARRMGGVSLESGAVTRFSVNDADAIAKIPGVKAVSPSVSGRAQAVYGNKNWNTQVQGVGVDYETMKASKPVAGIFFTEEDTRARRKVALLGLTVAKELFGDSNPIGQVIKINRINFKILGILPEKGSSPHGDRDDTILIPYTTAMYRLLGEEYLGSIDVEITDLSVMDDVEESIKTLVIKRHRLSQDSENSFNIRNMAEIQQALEGMTDTMTLLLGSIAAISLFVGGVGIMNIMLVSVTERTREIGLRKAIGARRRDILLQFLVESVVMTFGGGLIGIIFGIATAFLLSLFAGWATKVSLFSVILATGFSIVVGIGFGIWPARKAARLNPIEALRYE